MTAKDKGHHVVPEQPKENQTHQSCHGGVHSSELVASFGGCLGTIHKAMPIP
jgi:hypothetical protein